MELPHPHHPVPVHQPAALCKVQAGGADGAVRTPLHFYHGHLWYDQDFPQPLGWSAEPDPGTSVDFLSESAAFRTIYVASGIWQEAGWGTIIYMACLAAVDTSLYEAAKIDGASMFQRILHIDIPELVPMIVLQLIMSVGNLMNVGFEKVLLLQTELNKATSDIIAVYVYEQGIINAKYSYSTAVGLFNTVVNIILLIIVNRIAKKGGRRQLCVKGANRYGKKHCSIPSKEARRSVR